MFVTKPFYPQSSEGNGEKACESYAGALKFVVGNGFSGYRQLAKTVRVWST
jgi:hypothetical protein